MAQRTLTRAAFWAAGRKAEIDPSDVEAGTSACARRCAPSAALTSAYAAIQKLLMASLTMRPLMEYAHSRSARQRRFTAIEPARKAEALQPKDWRAPTLLGIAYEQAQRDDEARARPMKKAMSLAPGNPTVMSNYAMFLAAHGEGRAPRPCCAPRSRARTPRSRSAKPRLAGRPPGPSGRGRESSPARTCRRARRQQHGPYLQHAANGQGAPEPPSRSWDAMRATP